MAYNKKTWLARLGQGLNKFILNGGSRVTLESSPDTVTQQGTPLSADNMNDLEDRIDSEFTNVNSAINAIKEVSEITNLSQYVTDSAITIRDTFVAYRCGNIITISVDASISDTAIHTINIPQSVLPPPVVSLAMSSVEFGSDTTTSEYGFIFKSSSSTVVRLRVHTNNGRIFATATYIANIS